MLRKTQSSVKKGHVMGKSGKLVRPSSSGLDFVTDRKVLPWMHLKIFTNGIELKKLRWKEIPEGAAWQATSKIGLIIVRASYITGCCGNGSLRISCASNLNCADLRTLEFRLLFLGDVNAEHLLGTYPVKLPVRKGKPFSFNYQAVVSFGKGRRMHISLPLEQAHVSEIKGIAEGKRIRDFQISTVAVSPRKGRLDFNTVEITAGGDGFTMLESWAEDKCEKGKRHPAHAAGWNSWDYYGAAVSEEAVLENAEFIKSDNVLSKHIRKIIIDDGWEYCCGEWEANHHFPSGMQKLASRLSKMGFLPGLWIAPVLADQQSHIANFHPDMLAMNRHGVPFPAFTDIGRGIFVLDPTRRKVQEYLFNLAEKYVKRGYGYLKFDFIRQVLKADRFHDDSVPRGRIVAEVMKPLVSAIGGKAEVLGCNYLWAAGTSGIDYVRTGPDNRARWDRITQNAPIVSARYWSNGRLWVNDPDFALCRGPETSDDPDLHKINPNMLFYGKDTETPETYQGLASAKYEELKIMLSIIVTGGGEVILSDRLSRLNRKGLALARKAVSAVPGEAAKPVDLFETSMPSKYIQKYEGGHRILLINWGEAAKEISINLQGYGLSAPEAVDFWEDCKIKVSKGIISKTLQPHSCLLAEI